MTHPDVNGTAVEDGADSGPIDTAQAEETVIPSSAVPGPTLGQREQLIRYTTQRTQFLNECKDQYGRRFKLGLLPGIDFFVITDPGDVRAIFTAPRTSLHCGNSNGALEKYFGSTGIAFLDEGEHLARRKSLTRSFKGAAFNRIVTAVEEITTDSVAGWPRDEVVDMHPLVHRWAMNVIREVVYGKVVPSCWPELLDALMDMVELNRYPTAMLQIDRWSSAKKRLMKKRPSTGLKAFWGDRRRVDGLIAKSIAERLEVGEFGDDMLSVLFGVTRADGSQLSVMDLRDEIMTMFVAGTVTTVSAVCWSIEHFSRDPERLARLRDEIAAGETDEYLTAAVHEVLRLHPPLPNNLARQVVTPIVVGGVRYEPGQLLVPSAELMNNDPERYPEPEKFLPERFIGVQPGQYTWIPFGGGHTRCMGDRIAIHEIKTMVRELVTGFDFERGETDPAKPVPRGPVVVPQGGPRIALRPRAAMAAAN
ncbi:cytochrome P450 [Saccharothrix ecbatanensis]|uniref:Cytochrome P450 n=1 Tax=Saccharothrix ecbatanensis TaxID=1105145 RepID=A0A7W9HP31_9PSEU|nr:cytochrome P450 [Saccharothrix ecbatanensis]MBB5805651.1 cytochrome P450 [Saccharothrix ecbatanensis]